MESPVKRQTRSAASENGGGSGGAIEKSPIDARQGFRGRPVLYVLIASLVLALAAYLVLHFYFLGTAL
jgi:hypothetical protein